MQKILPSLHLLEIFMPVADREDFLLAMMQETMELPFYKGYELPVIYGADGIRTVRRAAEQGYQITQWASPEIIGKGCNLSSTDRTLRETSVEYAKELIRIAAQAGTTNVGLPSGPDPGEETREDAKKALFESYCALSQEAALCGDIHLTMEPLDRYVHKKQLMGPVHEVAEWFGGLK